MNRGGGWNNNAANLLPRVQTAEHLFANGSGDAMNEKPFDCVRMKWEIQQKLMRDEAGMTVEERNRHAETLALADPILGPWFHRLKAARPGELSLAEDAAPYRGGGQGGTT